MQIDKVKKRLLSLKGASFLYDANATHKETTPVTRGM
jgi:hypothetical protein